MRKRKKISKEYIYTFSDGNDKDPNGIPRTSTVIPEPELRIWMKDQDTHFASGSRKERKYCLPLFDEEDNCAEIIDELEPYDILTQKERDQEIRDFIDSLTEIQRRRVELRMEGKSITEIAEMEGVGYNKVKKSLEQVGVRYMKEMK